MRIYMELLRLLNVRDADADADVDAVVLADAVILLVGDVGDMGDAAALLVVL